MFLTGLLPLLLMLLVLHGSITSRFSGNEPLLLTRKGRSGKQTLCYFRRLFVVVFVVVVCLFVVILFRFFFLNVEILV